MKKVSLLIGFFVTTLLLQSSFFLIPTIVAAGDYIPLAPIDITLNQSDHKTTNFGTYVSGAFRLALALAGLLAVIRIVYGGIIYMSTDAVSGKNEGKEIFSGAIYGLLLALMSWLIMATINQQLLGTTGALNLDIGTDRVTQSNAGGNQTPPPTP